MSPTEVKDILDKLFSEKGMEVKGFKIKAKSPLVTNIEHEDGLTVIAFGSNQPKAEITKIFTLYAHIEQIVFGKTGGSIKLRNFPDLSFKYDNTTFGSAKCPVRCDNISKEIDIKYSDSTYKEIAKKCLQYGREWATICHESGITFSDADYADKYMLKRQCYKFVKDNIEEESKEKYGSVLLTFFLVYVILPAIIQWVVHRILDDLFND
jgi:ribosome-binding factor A